jgi:hypothetical protein
MGPRRYLGTAAFLPAAAVMLAANPSSAEETPPAPIEKPAHALCWRGKPLPECRSFLITEVGISYPLGDPIANGGYTVVAGDLGWMKNISERAAVGATVHARLGLADEYARAGVRARYRRWLGRRNSLDFSPGIILVSRETSTTDYYPPGFVASATFNLGTVAGLSLEADYGRYSRLELVALGAYEPRRFTDVTWRAGWKLGGVPGTIGMAPFIAGGILFLFVMGNR